MIIDTKSNKKPKIGFFPFFNSLGDTLPLLKVADYYNRLGGETVFYSHGGAYEELARAKGVKLIKVDPYYENKTNKEIVNDLYFGKNLTNAVAKEIEVLKNTEISLIVTNYNLSSGISARVLGIPLVVLFSASLSPPYFESYLATYPDKLENIVTFFIPSPIKNIIFNWYLLRSKSFTRFFNNVAQQYGKKPFTHYLDIFKGDYFLACDDFNFLKLKPTPDYPRENYVGPILPDNFEKFFSEYNDLEILRHIKKPGRSILLSMGSQGDKKFFLRLLSILNETEWNVIALYANILKNDELPKLSDNILLKKFASSIRTVNEQVDLAITHGGRGTIYNAVYSGKPIIGIPMQFEQQYNIDCIIRHSSGMKLSKKYFTRRRLLNAINNIFSNYQFYEMNARTLAKSFKQEDSVKNTVIRLIDILKLNAQNTIL